MSPSVYEVKISDFGYSKEIVASGSQMSVQSHRSAFFMPVEAKVGKFVSFQKLLLENFDVLVI